MLDFSNAVLTNTYMSWVGNKARYEGVRLPNVTFKPDIVLEEMLLTSMLKPYQKRTENFYLSETDDSDNRVKVLVSEIFQKEDMDSDTFTWFCNRLSNLLYEHMESPKATGGEFFVTLFNELYFEGEPVRAIGLWKVNSSAVYIKPSVGVNSTMEAITAIDINNIELSALIINIEESEGFRVLVVDRLSKPEERSMWKDEFLRLRPVEDDYFYTAHRMNATADFVQDKMKKYSLTRPERFALLVKIGDYFHDYPEYDEGDFLKQIFPEEDNRGQDYLDFIADYSNAYGINMNPNFEIDDLAKKACAKRFRVNVKLDKNFGLAVKTSRTDILERGFDEATSKQYYKVYYDEEA